MKIWSWQRTPAMLAATSVILVSALAHDSDNSVNSTRTSPSLSVAAPAEPGPHQATPKHKKTDQQRDPRRYKVEFRKIVQAELAEVPALKSRMTQLAQIQARRDLLQQQRKEAAEQSSTSRDRIIGRFHSLLKQDLELADRSREIAHDLVKNTPQIKAQIARRRAVLLENQKTGSDEETTSATTATPVGHAESGRDTKARLRYLDYLDRKLDELSKHPDRIDLLSRMIRGVPVDEEKVRIANRREAKIRQRDVTTTATRPGASTAEQLRRRRRNLQREIHELDQQIRQLEKADD